MQGWRRSPPSSRSRRRALTGQAVPFAFGCPRAFVRWSQWISPASTASPVRSADRRTMISFRHSAANFLQPAQGPETPPSFKEPPASKAPRRPSAARDGSKASASCRPAPRRPRARSAARSPQPAARRRPRPPRHAAASLAHTGLSRLSRLPHAADLLTNLALAVFLSLMSHARQLARHWARHCREPKQAGFEKEPTAPRPIFS